MNLISRLHLPRLGCQSNLDCSVSLISEAGVDEVSSRTKPVAIGIDVGSTTVKAVVVDPDTKEILWSDYLRHQTKQAEFVLSFLERIESCFPKIAHKDIR